MVGGGQQIDNKPQKLVSKNRTKTRGGGTKFEEEVEK